METATPLSLDRSVVHLAADGSATVIDEFGFTPADFETYVAQHCGPDDPGRMVMIERSDASWTSWECHPSGAELVVAISGTAVLVQEIDGEVRRTRLTAGQAVVNPPGVWHTADVEAPFTALYVTPAPGTTHRPR